MDTKEIFSRIYSGTPFLLLYISQLSLTDMRTCRLFKEGDSVAKLVYVTLRDKRVVLAYTCHRHSLVSLRYQII